MFEVRSLFLISARLTADGRRAAFLCLRFRPEAERRTSSAEPRTLNEEGLQATQSHPKAPPSLHQGYTKATPRLHQSHTKAPPKPHQSLGSVAQRRGGGVGRGRSEEHTSELQSLRHLVCRHL